MSSRNLSARVPRTKPNPTEPVKKQDPIPKTKQVAKPPGTKPFSTSQLSNFKQTPKLPSTKPISSSQLYSKLYTKQNTNSPGVRHTPQAQTKPLVSGCASCKRHVAEVPTTTTPISQASGTKRHSQPLSAVLASKTPITRQAPTASTLKQTSPLSVTKNDLNVHAIPKSALDTVHTRPAPPPSTPKQLLQLFAPNKALNADVGLESTPPYVSQAPSSSTPKEIPPLFTRAPNTDAPNGPPCFGCGLEPSGAETACTITPPYHPVMCDFSPEALRAAKKVVKEGEKKIEDLDRSIERLRRHRENLRLSVIQFKTHLAPISRISDDDLLLIFIALQAQTSSGYINESWTLAATCRRWRALAFSCSSLWKHIAVDLYSKDAKIPALLQCWRAEAQLQRVSPNIPLSCTLNVANDSIVVHTRFNQRGLAQLQQPVQRIVESLDRCSYVEVSGGITEWKVFPSHAPTFESLRTLKISHSSWLSSGFFWNTPVLQTVTLNTVEIDKMYPLRWKAVRFLELKDCVIAASKLVEVLRAAPQLDTLILSCIGRFPQDPDHALIPASPAHLPSLRTLKVNFFIHTTLFYCARATFDAVALGTVIRHIRVPGLAELSFSHAREEDIGALQTLVTYFGDPVTIKSLSCDTLKHPNAVIALSKLLPRLPSLQSLTIVSGPSDLQISFSPILSALHWSTPNENAFQPRWDPPRPQRLQRICPHLEHFSLQGLSVDSRLLQEMVQSRVPEANNRNRRSLTSPAPGPLRFLTLSNLRLTGDLRHGVGGHLKWLKNLKIQLLNRT